LLEGAQAILDEFDQRVRAGLGPVLHVLVQVPNLDADAQRELRAGNDPLHLARVQGRAGLPVDDVFGFEFRLAAVDALPVTDHDARRPQ